MNVYSMEKRATLVEAAFATIRKDRALRNCVSASIDRQRNVMIRLSKGNRFGPYEADSVTSLPILVGIIQRWTTHSKFELCLTRHVAYYQDGSIRRLDLGEIAVLDLDDVDTLHIN